VGVDIVDGAGKVQILPESATAAATVDLETFKNALSVLALLHTTSSSPFNSTT